MLFSNFRLSVIMGIFLALFLLACGKDTSTQSGPSGPPSYDPNNLKHSYDFALPDCQTGRHVFNSFESYCSALKDHALNNECAETQRKLTFETRNCSGSFE